MTITTTTAISTKTLVVVKQQFKQITATTKTRTTKFNKSFYLGFAGKGGGSDDGELGEGVKI